MVTTPLFYILLSRSLSKAFRSSHGLRQGEPLSQFLFIIVEEGLGHLIKEENKMAQIKGIKIRDTDILVMHKKCVGNNLLFGEPIICEAWALCAILEKSELEARMSLKKEK